jgi:hypothetical protein
MALARKKVRVEVGFAKKKNRKEPNRRSGDVESVVKNKDPKGGIKFDSAHADGSDRKIAESRNGMWLDGPDRFEVRKQRGNMAGCAGIDYERHRRRRSQRRVSREGSQRDRDNRRESDKGMIRVNSLIS